MEFERKLLGPHDPILTNGMFRQWFDMMNKVVNNKSRQRLVECRKLGKEVEKEFVITHGKEHPDYWKIVEHMDNMNMMLSFAGLK